MVKEVVSTERLLQPEKFTRLDPAGLPWSQGVKAKGTLFFTKQIPVDREGRAVGAGDIVRQTEQILENLRVMMEAAKGSLDDVVSTTWFTTDIEAFYREGASRLRKKYFTRDPPTSVLVEVRRLAFPEMMLELQATAVLEQ